MAKVNIRIPRKTPRKDVICYGIIEDENIKDTIDIEVEFEKYGSKNRGVSINFSFQITRWNMKDIGSTNKINIFKEFDSGFKNIDEFVNETNKLLERFNEECERFDVHSEINWEKCNW